MSISDKIKIARKNAGLTQQQLADIVGVSKSTVAGYELGSREPDSLKIHKIAKALNVSGDYLLGLDEPEAANPINDLSADALQYARDFDQLPEEYRRLARGFMELLKAHAIK